jgi:Mg-chelatase subunit ChlD
MRILSLVLLLVQIYTSGFSQKIKWEDTSVNFGAVRDWDSSPAVFRLTNTGSSKLMFLPQHYGRDVQVVLPNKSILPGESAQIEIHYYTANTGSFSKSVDIFSNASSNAQTLTLRGNILSLRNNALTACPTFGNNIPTSSSDPNIITVVNRVTSEQIVGARVELFKREDSRAVYETDQRGIVRSKMESGKYTAQVDKEGFYPTVQEITFGKGQPSVIIFLEPKRVEAIRPNPTSKPNDVAAINPSPESLGIGLNDQWDAPNTLPKKTPESEEQLGVGINDQWQEEPTQTPAEPAATNDQWGDLEVTMSTTEAPKPNPTPAPTQVPTPAPAPISTEKKPTGTKLSESQFRPNNILLLIDASSSMGKEGKIELLQANLAAMVAILRPIDKLTIVAYNSTAWTLLPPTRVTQNDSIIALILALTPESYTNGVKGMTEAYHQLLAEWVDGGNNQLIIATDGMFNSSKFTEQDAIELASTHAKQGIILSVVGLGDDKTAEKMMKRIARVGRGAYLRLDNATSPTGLLAEEIRMRSRKL